MCPIFLRRTALAFMLVGGFVVNVIAQHEHDYPEIGKLCPQFTLRDVTHYASHDVSLQDFSGKWLIMDFWSRSCLSCIKSFPKLNTLQKEFSSELQLLMIASDDHLSGKGISTFYDRLAAKYDLTMASAYDSIIFQRFGISTVPHVVIVDPQGIVRAVTLSENITKDNIQSLLKGIVPVFKTKLNEFQERDSFHVAREISSEGYSSVFDKWKFYDPIAIVTDIGRNRNEGHFTTVGASLNGLYTIAWFGSSDWSYGDSLYARCWPFPLVRSKDSVLFKPDFNKPSGLYNYSLIVPNSRSSMEFLQWAMQCDLRKYFALDVRVETRIMPCYELTVKKGMQLKFKTKGEPYARKVEGINLTLTNTTMDELLSIIASFHEDKPPFINSSGITSNFDITLDVIMTDLVEIKKGLRQHGLELKENKRPMKVLVIN